MATWPTPSARYRQYVDKVRACGHWVFVRMDGKAHAVIEHVATGQTWTYSTHDGGSEHNAARNFAKSVGDICGCVFIENRNRRRSRKAPQVSGFSLARAARESAAFHRAVDGEVGDLIRKRDRLIAEMKRLARKRSRDCIKRIPALIQSVQAIEATLSERFHQPVEPFDPMTLGDLT